MSNRSNLRKSRCPRRDANRHLTILVVGIVRSTQVRNDTAVAMVGEMIAFAVDLSLQECFGKIRIKNGIYNNNNDN